MTLPEIVFLFSFQQRPLIYLDEKTKQKRKKQQQQPYSQHCIWGILVMFINLRGVLFFLSLLGNWNGKPFRTLSNIQIMIIISTCISHGVILHIRGSWCADIPFKRAKLHSIFQLKFSKKQINKHTRMTNGFH